ncbi:piriformospora indica-insensitive protein 2-like [Humulus lupulus]|uniref:piriformospora indica-insensitive protein 2-like n=1 Tax=Humulus lupulus TaxID=3486 RepID=UPI002B404373|nr:piriformospora indica-insensitive protein 2-like [Humulus lupulus]
MKKVLVTIQGVILFLLYFSSSVFVMCEDEIVLDSASSLAPMEKTEQEALYAAIQSFVGKWWNGSDLYPDPCGWTPIQGVYCDLYDGLWYISDINIGPVYDNSLKCSPNAKISHHLFKLKHLKTLSIFSCFFSQNRNPITISTFRWEKFTHSLESLEFRLNPGLIGTVPTTMGNLTKLQSLVLLENGLTGELPTEIGNLVNLRKLVLSRNHFLGQIPSSFGQLSELLILDASSNSLSGSLPLRFGSLRSLLKLDLSNNMLKGNLPREIGKLNNLTLLDLGSNRFSGGLLESLGEMVSLKEMVISNNPVGGDLKSNIEWKKLQNLEILDLSNSSLTGDIPESLAEMKRLRFLGLSYNNLSGIVPPRLASLPCISTLYLGGNNLTGELGFSEGFYRKMGWRFGAWNNPNLCYNMAQLTSSTTSYAPHGVRPCNQESNSYKRVSNEKISNSTNGDWNTTDNFFSVRSLGFLSCSVGGFWHVFCVQGMLIMFLWSVML